MTKSAVLTARAADPSHWVWGVFFSPSFSLAPALRRVVLDPSEANGIAVSMSQAYARATGVSVEDAKESFPVIRCRLVPDTTEHVSGAMAA